MGWLNLVYRAVSELILALYCFDLTPKISTLYWCSFHPSWASEYNLQIRSCGLLSV